MHVLAHWNNSLQVDMSLHIILSAPTRVCSSSLKLHDWWKSSKYQFYSLWTYLTMASPRFLCRLTAFMDLLLPWDVRELYIRKTADLLLQLLVGTFPRFVAIRFYFLSEPTIYWIYLTMAWTHDLLDLPDHGLNPRSTGFTPPWLEPTIYHTWGKHPNQYTTALAAWLFTQIQLQIILFLLFWDVLWIIKDLLAPLSLFLQEFQENSKFLRTISNPASVLGLLRSFLRNHYSLQIMHLCLWSRWTRTYIPHYSFDKPNPYLIEGRVIGLSTIVLTDRKFFGILISTRLL